MREKGAYGRRYLYRAGPAVKRAPVVVVSPEGPPHVASRLSPQAMASGTCSYPDPYGFFFH